MFYLLQDADNIKKPYERDKRANSRIFGKRENGWTCSDVVLTIIKNGRIKKTKTTVWLYGLAITMKYWKPKLLVGAMAFRTEANKMVEKHRLRKGHVIQTCFTIAIFEYTGKPAAHLIRTGVEPRCKQNSSGWPTNLELKQTTELFIHADLIQCNSRLDCATILKKRA